MITLELLQKLAPTTKREVLLKYVEPLNRLCEEYDMFVNPHRVAMFLAQVAHESGGFNFVSENLNYSADALRTVFKKYFPTVALSQQYARQPELIANRVYGSRMGNGPEDSGDGWKYRGRGLIQLTGKNNYTKFANDLGLSINEAVAYLQTPEGAVESACWFWDINKLNAYADKDDLITVTKRINGGVNGLADRDHRYDIALAALGK